MKWRFPKFQLPPRAVSPTAGDRPAAVASSPIAADEHLMSQMVPELKKLLDALHRSNLTRNELAELTAQLEQNNMLLVPRENTTPVPSELNVELERKHGVSDTAPPAISEAHRRLVERNLQALRRALSDSPASDAANRLAAAQQQPPMVLARAKPPHSTDTTLSNTVSVVSRRQSTTKQTRKLSMSEQTYQKQQKVLITNLHLQFFSVAICGAKHFL